MIGRATQLSLLVGVLHAGVALAQAPQSHSQHTGWLAPNVGLTLAGPGSEALYVVALDLQFQRNHGWFGLRGAGMFGVDSDQSVGELAALYGRATRSTNSQAAVGGGLSVIEVCDAGCATTVGFAFTGRAAIRPLKQVGLGLQLLGNLNSETPVVAFTLFLEIGKVR